MDGKRMDELFSKIKAQNPPPPGLSQRLLEGAGKAGRASSRPRVGKLALQTAIFAVLAVAASITALAAALPGFRAWLFGPDSGLGDFLRETAAVTQADGFQVEVLGSITDQGNVVVYYTLRDAAGQGRLSMDVLVESSAGFTGKDHLAIEAGSYLLNTHTEVLDYEPDSQSLLCRLSIAINQEWLSENAGSLFGYQAEGSEVQLYVNRIRTRDEREYFTLPLSQLILTEETLPIRFVRNNTVDEQKDGRFLFGSDEFITPEEYSAQAGSYTGLFHDLMNFAHFRDDSGVPSVLKPLDPERRQQEWLYAAGFLNDELHVQVRPLLDYQSGEEHTGVSGVYCTESGGEDELIRLVESAAKEWKRDARFYSRANQDLIYSEIFEIDESEQVIYSNSMNDHDNRQEYCFSLSPEELEGHSLVACYQSTKDVYPGLATGSFPLGDQPLGEAQAFSSLNLGGIQIDRLRVSPLGVIFVGPWEELIKIESLEVVSGSRSASCSLASNISWSQRKDNPEQAASVTFFVDSVPVDMEGLTALRVNGQEFPLG